MSRKLYHADAAAHVGLAPSTWRDYYANRRTPPFDGQDVDRGHLRPWWYAETLDNWQRPGQGARTDVRPERNWTLTADMTAGQLANIVADKLPGQVQPGVSGGRRATVTVRAGRGAPPRWMTEIQREYPGLVVGIE